MGRHTEAARAIPRSNHRNNLQGGATSASSESFRCFETTRRRGRGLRLRCRRTSCRRGGVVEAIEARARVERARRDKRRRRTRAGYNEWVLCLKKTDGDEDACKPMRQFALSICPDDWYNKWDEEREEGTFSGIKFSA